MLTGLLAPTEGSATVYGLPLDDMAGIRALIGVCPQHDVLMEHLTVSEHLQLVGQLKGVAANVIQKMVQESVQMLGLASKHASVGTTLSGGTSSSVESVCSCSCICSGGGGGGGGSSMG